MCIYVTTTQLMIYFSPLSETSLFSFPGQYFYLLHDRHYSGLYYYSLVLPALKPYINGIMQYVGRNIAPKMAHSHGWQVDMDCQLGWRMEAQFLSIWASPHGLYFLTVLWSSSKGNVPWEVGITGSSVALLLLYCISQNNHKGLTQVQGKDITLGHKPWWDSGKVLNEHIR